MTTKLTMLMALCICCLPAFAGADEIVEQFRSDAGEKIAIVVGIADYPYLSSEEYSEIRYAAANAEKIARTLKQPQCGFRESNVFLLLNDAAGRAAILDTIDMLKQKYDSYKDTVYFYFCGHGEIDSEYCDCDNASCEFLLKTYNTSNNSDSEISFGELYRELRQFEADNVVVFIDACHSGACYIPTLAGRDNSKDKLRIFTSTGCALNSYEDVSIGHSVFAWFLLKALGGHADDMVDDAVTTSVELSEYIQQSVETYVDRMLDKNSLGLQSNYLHLQSPQTIGVFWDQNDFVFVKRNGAPVERDDRRRDTSGQSDIAESAVTDVCNRAELCMLRHKYDEAIGILRTVIQEYPRAFRGHQLLGEVYCRTRQWKEAQNAFLDAIAADPDNIRVKVLLGNAFMMTGDFARSRYFLQAAARSDSDKPTAYYNLALLHERHLRYAEAIEYYERFCELASGVDDISAGKIDSVKNNIDAMYKYAIHFEKGKELLRSNNPGEAEREFNIATRIDKYRAEGWYELGKIQYERQDYSQAARSFKYTVAAAPQYQNSYYLLAKSFEELGEYEYALGYLEVYLDKAQHSLDGFPFRAEAEISRNALERKLRIQRDDSGIAAPP